MWPRICSGAVNLMFAAPVFLLPSDPQCIRLLSMSQTTLTVAMHRPLRLGQGWLHHGLATCLSVCLKIGQSRWNSAADYWPPWHVCKRNTGRRRPTWKTRRGRGTVLEAFDHGSHSLDVILVVSDYSVYYFSSQKVWCQNNYSVILLAMWPLKKKKIFFCKSLGLLRA